MSTPLRVTRIGHACQLIELGGLRVLTDPWFTQTATYYQGEPVTLTVGSLGRVDAVVVSHEHYDHCDLDALVTGGRRPRASTASTKSPSSSNRASARSSSAATRCEFRNWTRSRTGSAPSTWPSCRRTACASGR